MLIPGCVSFLLTSTCLEAMSGCVAEGSCWGKAPFLSPGWTNQTDTMLRAWVFHYSCKSPLPAAQWKLISGSNFCYSGILYLPPLFLPFFLSPLPLSSSHPWVFNKLLCKTRPLTSKDFHFWFRSKDLQIQCKFCVIAKVRHPNAWIKISPR